MKGSRKRPLASELSVPGVDLGQLERLLSFMSEHGLEEFEYAHGDLRIRLKKAVTPQSGPPTRGLPVSSENLLSAAPIQSPTVSAQVTPVPPPTDELHVIKSPIVGTFFAGASPGAEPFVKVGDLVEAGQTVCIIEAMKLMNEIEADVSGEMVRVLVENGQPVEYGKPLFALRPAGK